MDLRKSDVVEFQELMLKRFDVEVDYQTAYRKLSMLVRQVEIVYRPIKKKKPPD